MRNEKVMHIVLIGLFAALSFDPMLDYFYKLIILGKPAEEFTLVWNIVSASINAFTSTVVSVAAYIALRPALLRANMIPAPLNKRIIKF